MPSAADLLGRQLMETNLINLFGGERRTLVTRVAGLTADAAVARVARRAGRLDDVRGGRLGGIGRVLRQAGHLGR